MRLSRGLAARGPPPQRGEAAAPLPGLPRLPGDDNFPATGSSWPGLAALPPRAPGDGHGRPDRRVAAPTAPRSDRARGSGGPPGGGCGGDAGGEGGAGRLTGAAGVAATSGSRAPGAGARSPPPLLLPPAAAASAQWLGLGLGGSPESGLSRTPSPFFFVSTSSGTSCRLSRPTMAASAARRAGGSAAAGECGAQMRGQGRCPPRRPRALRVSPASAEPDHAPRKSHPGLDDHAP